MILSRAYVDGFLVAWDEGDYKAEVIFARQQSKEIKPILPAGSLPAGRRGGTTAARAQQVRARLSRTARKVPEVMVKITSKCRGMTQIGRHLDYISRKGQIDLEDQDGLIIRGKDRIKDLKEDWRIGGPEEIGPTSERSDTFNIVFSMPAHTDEVAMKRAVRAFAASEFAGHQFVFAYHTQATDPDPNPPAHPHVHLSVKALGNLGHRLNPRKKDLQRWREEFAGQLRAHGIEANATSRLARLNRDPGAKRAELGMAARDEPVLNGGAGRHSKAGSARADRLEADRVAHYQSLVVVLGQSEDAADRDLAALVSTYLTEIAPKRARAERPDPDKGKDIER
jgi:hypothetical protein